MDSHGIHVITIANSIIGVSILAMPYCFKQCGIILSIVMLIISSIISRLSCHFLLKSAIRARLRTFEFLAYHAFGPFGKFVVEIGMIGFLLGTCIAFFVVMGDLGPEIVAQMIGIPNTDTLRSIILISLAVFCVLPLGLLRNVDSLNGVCIATIGFYVCLVLKIMAESASHIVTGDWYNKVDLWKTEGALQCTPIFSMALFCQTQLFEIYQAIPNASLEKMNALIRIAVNICTCVYIFVGVFGYIAISDKAFTGNILLSLTPSLLTEIIKIGFVLSLAFSFPLIIFPCRASLFSLIYKPTYTMLHDTGSHFIPETKFRSITIFIIAISLGIGILIPSIELVLGLVGSTIGVSICVLFPTTCFICMVKKNTNERVLAQVMLCIGIVVMVLGTYANLNAVDDIKLGAASEHTPLKLNSPEVHKVENKVIFDIPSTVKLEISSTKFEKFDKGKAPDSNVIKETRHEPPQPMPPLEQSKEIIPKEIKLPQVIPEEPKTQPKAPDLKEIRHEPPQPVEPEQSINQIKQNESPLNLLDKDSKINTPKDNVSLTKQSQENVLSEGSVNDQVDAEAIKKEEKEISQQAQEELKNVVQKLNLISELQKQNQEQQQQIVEQQQKLWEEMKQRKNVEQELMEVDKVKQEKLKAVKEIQDIAKKAIESLADDDSKGLLESKIIVHPNDKPNITNLTNNSSILTQNNVIINPAPLSYQLGLNAATETHSLITEKSLSDFVPLPIIKSNMLNNNISVNQSHNISQNSSDITIKHSSLAPSLKKLNIVENNKEEVNLPVQVNSNVTPAISIQKVAIFADNKENIISENKNELEDIKLMRRDILSENKSSMQNKIKLNSVENNKEEVNFPVQVNSNVISGISSQKVAIVSENKNELEDIKSMRRDILSENENSMRNKRDLSDSHIENQVNIQSENKTDYESVPKETDENKVNGLLPNLELTNLTDNTKNVKEDGNCDKP